MDRALRRSMPKNDPESFRGKTKHRALHGGQAMERTISPFERVTEPQVIRDARRRWPRTTHVSDDTVQLQPLVLFVEKEMPHPSAFLRRERLRKKRARTAARWAWEIPALARVFFLPPLWLSPAAGGQHLTSNSRWA